jgi:hypothetical protein
VIQAVTLFNRNKERIACVSMCCDLVAKPGLCFRVAGWDTKYYNYWRLGWQLAGGLHIPALSARSRTIQQPCCRRTKAPL